MNAPWNCVWPRWGEPAVAAALAVVVLAASGVPADVAARAVLAVAWIVMVPGVALATRLDLGGGARWGTGAVLGAAAIGPVFTAAVVAFAPAFDPAAVVLAYPIPFAVWLVFSVRRFPEPGPRPVDRKLWGAAALMLVFLALVYLPAFRLASDGEVQIALRPPFLNSKASCFHVAVAGQFGLDRRLAAPFAADHGMTLFHLHSYALMAVLDRLAGAGPLLVEFRLYPLFATFLALVGLRAALPSLGVPRAAATGGAVVALIGSPFLTLAFGVLPQTALALTFFATAAALTASGLSRGKTADLVAGGALFGILAQVEMQWAAVVLPGVLIGILLPGGGLDWKSRLCLGASAAAVAALATALGLLVTGPGAGPLPIVFRTGGFAWDAVRAFSARAAPAPGLAVAASAAAGAVYLAALWYARAGWRAAPPPVRRIFGGVAAAALFPTVFLNIPVLPAMVAYFTLAAFAPLSMAAAAGLAAAPGPRARIWGIVLVAAPFAMAAATLWLPADTAALDAAEQRALSGLRAATGPREVVAARDRPPREALLWAGVSRRKAAGWVVGPEMAPRYEAIFRAPGVLARAQRVQGLLDALPDAGSRGEAAAILGEIGATAVEIPHGAAGAPALQGLLLPISMGPRSGYYRVDAAALKH